MEKKISQLILTREKDNVYIIYLRPRYRNILTPSLVDEIRLIQDTLVNDYFRQHGEKKTYVVLWCSADRVTLHMRFDKHFIYNCLRLAKEHVLLDYFDRVINILYLNYYNFGLPFLNVSFLDGFEGGISEDFLSSLSINLVSHPEKINVSSLNGMFRKNSTFNLIDGYDSVTNLAKKVEENILESHSDLIINPSLRRTDLIELLSKLSKKESMLEFIKNNKWFISAEELDYYKKLMIRYFEKQIRNKKMLG